MDWKINSMACIFTIIFISKLVLNLCKNFFAIAWYQKPTYSVINPPRIFVPEDKPNPTQIWTLVVQPDPKSGSNRVQLSLSSILQGWTLYWTLFEVNPTLFNPFFCPWGPDLNLNSGPAENRVGFGHTRILTLAEAVYFFVGNSGRNSWRIPMLFRKNSD